MNFVYYSEAICNKFFMFIHIYLNLKVLIGVNVQGKSKCAYTGMYTIKFK